MIYARLFALNVLATSSACLPAERCAVGGFIEDDDQGSGCTAIFTECENRDVIDLRVVCDGVVCTCMKTDVDSRAEFGSFGQRDFCDEASRADADDTANDHCGLGWQVAVTD